MHFTYPAFLFALATLAIPVIVHLFNFRRYQKVYFSNVQFLKEIKEQQSSRRNIRERLILAARLLALTFLVLAFARPYLAGDQPAASAGQHEAVSIFVDNSYSMQMLNREGSLLDEAKRRAKEIAAAYSINDRFQLLTQDFEGKHQRLLNRDEFNNAVDTIRISSQSRTLEQILNRQQSLLQPQAGMGRAAYIISDFQKNQYEKPVKPDTGMQVNLVQLKANSLPNVAVDSVWLLSAIHRPAETERLVVKLHNYAGEDAKGIPLKLLINKQQKALGSFTVKAHAIQLDTLAFSGLQPGWQQAEIQLQDNPVIFDNQFYFSFEVRKQMPVLLIDGGVPDIYLAAVFGSDPFFAVTRTNDGNVNYSGLATFPLIVLSDVKAVSTGLSQQLKTYVTKGGTLAVFPADGADVAGYQSLLQPMGAAYPDKLLTENTRVSALNLQNPLFKSVFEDAPNNPDLPVIKKYYQLNTATRSAGEVLMELPGKQPFWTGYRSGSGKVYVSAVPLNETYSNLPRHALLLPVMYRMALLSGHDAPLFYTIGKDETIETAPLQLSEKQLLKLTNGKQTLIPDARQQEGSTLLYVADQVQQPGGYKLTVQDSTLAVVAFNNNRHESDLQYLDKATLGKLLPAGNKVIEAGGKPLNSVISDTNLGRQLWKLCIILALVFLAAEILLVRFYRIGKEQV